MTLNFLAFVLSVTLPTSFSVNDKIEFGSYQFDATYENLNGSIDVYYSFSGTPSAPLSIQLSNQSGVIVNHQMTPNDFYSGVVDNNGLRGGNIYKWSYEIENITRSTIYYFSLVNDNSSTISYTGGVVNFQVIANVYDFENEYNTGFQEGVSYGYNQGYDVGFNTGFQEGISESNQNFNLNWLSSIFSIATQFFNIEILPGFKLIYLIAIPLFLSLGYMILKIFR